MVWCITFIRQNCKKISPHVNMQVLVQRLLQICAFHTSKTKFKKIFLHLCCSKPGYV